MQVPEKHGNTVLWRTVGDWSLEDNAGNVERRFKSYDEAWDYWFFDLRRPQGYYIRFSVTQDKTRCEG